MNQLKKHSRRSSKKKSLKNDINWNSLLEAASGDIRRLDNVTRFSSIPFTFAELTSTHSYWVSLYSAMICKALGEYAPPLGDVLLHALMHDAGESLTGDVIRLMKYSTPEMKYQVDRSEAILTNKLFPIQIKELLQKPSMKSKVIVKAADFMSLLQFMRREAMRTNYEIMPYYKRMQKDLLEESKKVPCWINGIYESMIDDANFIAEECFGEKLNNHLLCRKI